VSSNRKPILRFLNRHFFPPIAIWIYRRLAGSWRYVIENGQVLTELQQGSRPVVGAFLHGRTFQLLHYFSLPECGRWILMCSASRDGEFMSRVEQGLGFRVVRGSSGGGGARALVQMIKAQREDPRLSSCLAVDGSRGPRAVAQLGTLTLAQKTGGSMLGPQRDPEVEGGSPHPHRRADRGAEGAGRRGHRGLAPAPGAEVARHACGTRCSDGFQ
jgi:hypothetical protein